MKREYVETKDGVHIMSPIGGSEHTLCGDAFDNEYEPGLGFKKRSPRPLTCPKCVTIILYCRGVRVGTPPAGRGPSSEGGA